MNPFDILGSVFLIIMYMISASKKSFNPKTKFWIHVFAICGSVMYSISGFMIGTDAIGLIITSVVAFMINIVGIYNYKKIKKEKFKINKK